MKSRCRGLLLLAVLPALPAGAALGYWLYPDLEPGFRYGLSAFAWALCFGPFFGWWRNETDRPLRALGFFMGGIVLRLMGLLGVVIWIYKRPDNAVGVILFAVTIGSFLFFEVVSMVSLRILSSQKDL